MLNVRTTKTIDFPPIQIERGEKAIFAPVATDDAFDSLWEIVKSKRLPNGGIAFKRTDNQPDRKEGRKVAKEEEEMEEEQEGCLMSSEMVVDSFPLKSATAPSSLADLHGFPRDKGHVFFRSPQKLFVIMLLTIISILPSINGKKLLPWRNGSSNNHYH